MLGKMCLHIYPLRSRHLICIDENWISTSGGLSQGQTVGSWQIAGREEPMSFVLRHTIFLMNIYRSMPCCRSSSLLLIGYVLNIVSGLIAFWVVHWISLLLWRGAPVTLSCPLLQRSPPSLCEFLLLRCLARWMFLCNEGHCWWRALVFWNTVSVRSCWLGWEMDACFAHGYTESFIVWSFGFLSDYWLVHV